LFTVKRNNNYLVEEAIEIENNDELILKKYTEGIQTSPLKDHIENKKDKSVQNENSYAENDDIFGEIQSHKSKSLSQSDDEYGEFQIEEIDRDNPDFYQLSKEGEGNLEEKERKFVESENDDTIPDDSKSSVSSNISESFCEIDVEEIQEKEYETREGLSQELNKWSSQYNFKLSYETAERSLVKENCLVSRLQCGKRGCPFYLEFKTQLNEKYKLSKYFNEHDHQFKERHTAKDVTTEIYERIRTLKSSINGIAKLTKTINDEFKKKFSRDAIKYQVQRLKEEELGKASEDANRLVKMLTKDCEERNYYFKKENDQLKNICFMTERMVKLANTFSDVLILDTTHKTNRFNLPLLDIIVINNLGRSCTCFIALLENQKTESILWALRAFKEKLTVIPNVIFSDEDEAIVGSNNFLILF